MSVLLQSFNDPVGHHAELLKYYPIAVVAAMQGYFRARLADVIDTGEPYLTNAITFNPQIKVDGSMAGAIAAGKLTFGQILMHSVSLNSFEEIVSVLTAISGQKDVLKQISAVAYRPIGADRPRPLMSKPQKAWRHLGQVFEKRHILSHEIASDLQLSESEIRELLITSQEFMRASAEWIAQLIDPNKGLSYEEIQRRRLQKLDKARSTVKMLIQYASEAFKEVGEMEESQEAIGELQDSVSRLMLALHKSNPRIDKSHSLFSYEIEAAETELLKGVDAALRWLLVMLESRSYGATGNKQVESKSKRE